MTEQKQENGEKNVNKLKYLTTCKKKRDVEFNKIDVMEPIKTGVDGTLELNSDYKRRRRRR